MAKNKVDAAPDGDAKRSGGKSGLDITSIVGWLLIVVVVVFGIITTTSRDPETNSPSMKLEEFVTVMANQFVDPPSIIIVVGGCIAALMLSYPLKTFAQIPKHLKIIFLPNKYNPRKTIDQIVEFAKEARINGLLALEDKLANTDDEFLRNSLMLVVDSVEPEKVTLLLETELNYLDERHAQARAFYQSGAALGPAFGMLGTLIGLIKLLKNLSPDMTLLGSAMAVALVTTFYGSLLANVVFAPIATKLKARHDEEYLCKMLIAEGVQAIQAGDNPRFIQEKLTQLIPKVKATKGMTEDDGEDGGKKGRKK